MKKIILAIVSVIVVAYSASVINSIRAENRKNEILNRESDSWGCICCEYKN